MPSIRKEIALNSSATRIWDAVRDFQAVHKRVAPGFLLDNKPEEGARLLTFANGNVFREFLVDCNDQERRLVYAISQQPFLTYSAALQIFEDGAGKSHLVWIVDFLPTELKENIDEQMDAALKVMKATLEQ